MSELVSFVSAKVDFFAFVAIYVISLSLKKPAHTNLNAVSTLRSVTVRGSSLVISSGIFFVTGRRFLFLLGNNFPPLMMSAIRGSSKLFRFSRWSM